MKKFKPILLSFVTVAVALGVIFTVVQAGNLNPPGAVNSTMRTLQEIYDHISTRASQADVSSLDVAVSSRQRALGFAGYTSGTYTGNLGGAKGANEKCDAGYDGSHWCSVDELMRLGDKYPWTYTVWVRDAVRGAAYQSDAAFEDWKHITVYGGAGAIGVLKVADKATCGRWKSNYSGDYGPRLNGEFAAIDFTTCDISHRLGCCY